MSDLPDIEHNNESNEEVQGFALNEEAQKMDSDKDSIAFEDLLRIYIGPNADKFLSMEAGTAETGYKKTRSWNVATFFMPLIWFFYRKLYLAGIMVAVIIPIIIGMVFPDLPRAVFTGLNAAIAAYANFYYLDTAKKKVLKMMSLGLSKTELQDLALKKGGVSEIGAVIGGLIMASFIAISLMDVAENELPSCDAPVAQQLLKNVISSQSTPPIPSELLVINGIQLLETKPNEENICRYDISIDKEIRSFQANISWHDQSTNQFSLQVFLIPPKEQTGEEVQKDGENVQTKPAELEKTEQEAK